MTKMCDVDLLIRLFSDPVIFNLIWYDPIIWYGDTSSFVYGFGSPYDKLCVGKGDREWDLKIKQLTEKVEWVVRRSGISDKIVFRLENMFRSYLGAIEIENKYLAWWIMDSIKDEIKIRDETPEWEKTDESFFRWSVDKDYITTDSEDGLIRCKEDTPEMFREGDLEVCEKQGFRV